MWYRTKPVNKPDTELQQILRCFDGVKFLVQTQPFGNVRDVMIGDQNLHVCLNHTIFNKLPGLIRFVKILKLLLLQLKDCLIEDLLIHIKSNLRDKPALLSSKNIPGSPDIEVPHSNIKPASQVGELLYCAQPFPGFIG